MKALLSAVTLSLTICACAQITPGFTVRRYCSVTDPVRLSFAADGSLLAGRDNTGSGGTNGEPVKIHRVAPCGVSVAEIGASPTIDPDSVVADNSGWFGGGLNSALVGGTNGTQGRISAISPSNAVSQMYFGNGCINPSDMVVLASNKLLVADPQGNRVCLFTSPGVVSNYFSQTSVVFVNPAVNGDLFTCSSTGVVQRRNSTGGVISASLATIPGTGSLAFGVATQPGGAFGTDLYAIRSGNLMRITTAGMITTIGTGFPAECWELEFGPDNAMYISAHNQDEVLRLAPAGTSTVSGSISFEDNLGAAITTVPIELRRVGDGVLVSTTSAAINQSGQYSTIDIPETGCYYLSAKTGTWLRDKVLVDARTSLVGPANLILKNGNCNGDDVIDIADYQILASAFDATADQPNWDVRGDLNRDGIVDIADYGVLSRNFDLSDE